MVDILQTLQVILSESAQLYYCYSNATPTHLKLLWEETRCVLKTGLI